MSRLSLSVIDIIDIKHVSIASLIYIKSNFMECFLQPLRLCKFYMLAMSICIVDIRDGVNYDIIVLLLMKYFA